MSQQAWCGFCNTTHAIDKHRPKQETATAPPPKPDPICACGFPASEHPLQPPGKPICFGDDKVRAYPPYRVDSKPTCEHCESKVEYYIVHTATDTEISSFVGDDKAEEAAEDLCEQLNRAVELERELRKSRRKVWTIDDLMEIRRGVLWRTGNVHEVDVFTAIAAKLNEVAD